MSKITQKTHQVNIVRTELLANFQACFSDFLTRLDQLLDKCLVKTFAKLLEVLWLMRYPNGLLLSELGACILSSSQAPAGTKRISNLLRSPKWSEEVVHEYLYERGTSYVKQVVQSNREVLLIWDNSQNSISPIFDRGFSGKPWLTLLCNGQDRFVVRWPQRYELIDARGRIKKAWMIVNAYQKR